MTVGFVMQRFVRDDGSPTLLGAELLDEYERGVPTSELYERYFLSEARMLERLIGRLGGTWRKDARMYVSTAKLMRLYTEHQDCGVVAALTGLKRIGVYQRLRRAGWSDIKGGFVRAAAAAQQRANEAAKRRERGL